MFLTRAFQASRTNAAFLSFNRDIGSTIVANSPSNIKYSLNKSEFLPSLRTPVGVDTMKIDSKLDYIAHKPYKGLDKVTKASGFDKTNFAPKKFWKQVSTELKSTSTNLVVSRRIGVSSPNTHLISYFSNKKFSPLNTLNVVLENDLDKAKSLCIVINSIIFFAQWYLLKEDSTARYSDIRHYDYSDTMIVCKEEKTVKKLVKLFDRYSNKKFPPLREQFDKDFLDRYADFWKN